MATQEVAQIIVGFTRNDGIFLHLQVPKGTKVSQVLTRKGYAQTELEATALQTRVNGNSIEDILNYELKKDDVIMVLPAVKGA